LLDSVYPGGVILLGSAKLISELALIVPRTVVAHREEAIAAVKVAARLDLEGTAGHLLKLLRQRVDLDRSPSDRVVHPEDVRAVLPQPELTALCGEVLLQVGREKGQIGASLMHNLDVHAMFLRA